MIARLTVATPFVMVVPEGASYAGYTYEDEGYAIMARPPAKSDVPLPHDIPNDLKIDGKTAFAANALQFDFRKPEFDRRKTGGVDDPSVELMQRVVASFIARLRYVARGTHVQPIDFASGATWRLRYLNDDGSELPEDPDLVRGRGMLHWNWSFVGVTPAVWDHVYELEADWIAPVWDDILLDATNALPKIGTAVVLAATALEVFIADVLERLSATGDIPPDIWQWINDRDNWLKDPSTEEQFDVLLKHFVGHSLKEETTLWPAFKELRTARNTFVHEGRATVGGAELKLARTSQLVGHASEIIGIVRNWLAPEHQWSQFDTKMDVSMTLRLPVNQVTGGAT